MCTIACIIVCILRTVPEQLVAAGTYICGYCMRCSGTIAIYFAPSILLKTRLNSKHLMIQCRTKCAWYIAQNVEVQPNCRCNFPVACSDQAVRAKKKKTVPSSLRSTKPIYFPMRPAHCRVRRSHSQTHSYTIQHRRACKTMSECVTLREMLCCVENGCPIESENMSNLL